MNPISANSKKYLVSEEVKKLYHLFSALEGSELAMSKIDSQVLLLYKTVSDLSISAYLLNNSTFYYSVIILSSYLWAKVTIFHWLSLESSKLANLEAF